MLKPVIAAAAVIAVAGSSIVYAQQGPRDHHYYGGWGPRAERHQRPSAQDMAAYTDARIAALKAGLELTSDQAKNWPAFEQALRDMAQLRIERIEARQARRDQVRDQAQTDQKKTTDQQTTTDQQQQANQQDRNGPFDRLARRADDLAKTSAALKKVADAGAPLYQSLTDAQKQRFVTLARVLRPRMVALSDRGGGGWRHDHDRFDRDRRG